MMIVQVNNLPQNYKRFRYIVAQAVNGQVWFYGAWDSNHATNAVAQAKEIGGFVVENPCDEEW